MTGTLDITGKQIVVFLKYSLFVLGTVIFAGGAWISVPIIMFWGMFLLFISNLFFGFDEGNTRFIFLFFHLAIFTFLIARPFILIVQGKDWVWYGKEATCAALMMLFLSLLSLRIGALIGDGVLKRYDGMEKTKEPVQPSEYQQAFLKSLQIVSLIFFIVMIAASFAEGFEKLYFMQGKSYNDYFLSYESSLPGAVLTMASMAKYAMSIFLATFPKKRAATAVLLIYLLDAVPWFLIGVRNPLVLRLLFFLVYYIFRQVTGENGEKWIGRFLKVLIIVGVPVMVAFMSIYSSIRVDKEVDEGFGESIGSFFYDQGTSFDTLRSVYDAIPDLPSEVPKNYTFGPFTDYLVHGSVGQKLFGAVDIGNNNSAVKAIYGSNLAHSSMYTIKREKYLQGWGRGSSYMLENYVDWGYGGVIIFSLILGAVLALFIRLLKSKNTLIRTIVLVSLLGLFFMPRAEATDWIVFLVYAQFWALIIVVYLLAGLCVRKYSYKRSKSPGRLFIKEEKYSV